MHHITMLKSITHAHTQTWLARHYLHNTTASIYATSTVALLDLNSYILYKLHITKLIQLKHRLVFGCSQARAKLIYVPAVYPCFNYKLNINNWGEP